MHAYIIYTLFVWQAEKRIRQVECNKVLQINSIAFKLRN